MTGGGGISRPFLVTVGIAWGSLALVALIMSIAIDVESQRLFEARADVRAADPDSWARERKRTLLTATGLAAGIAALAAWGLSWRYAQRVSATLSYADALAGGRTGAVPLDDAGDEIGAINLRLRRIADDLRARSARSARAEKELGTILSGMSEGVVAIDDQGKVLMVNEAAADMISASRDDDLKSRHIGDIEGELALSAVLIRAAERAEQLIVERKRVRDGRKHHYEVRASPLRDADKRITGAVAVMHDMTTMKLAEKMRRDFVANVSHELKTPLTAIHAAAATLLDAPEMSGDTRRKFIANIHRNAERLEQLIGDILELSRIQQGPERLDFEKVDLSRVVADVVSRLRETAVSRSIELTWERPPHALMLHADRQALTSIVENLVANALHYTPEGGRVGIELPREPDRVGIVVTDNGIGIAPKHHDRIFERFYRIDKARSRDEGGTGLGLAIVKNYVQAHGGDIRLESELDQGSTFSVTLPLGL